MLEGLAANADGDAGNGGSAAGCDTEGPTYHANCPSAIFAHELKSYSDSEDPVVVEYNRPLMEKKCMQSSAEYDPNLDLDIIVRELFQPDEWWKTRDLLFDSLAHFGTIRGFKPTIKNGIIICNYKGGGLQAGCTFLFNLKALHNPKVYPQNYNHDNPGKSKPRNRADYTKETKIVSEAPGKKSKPTCYNHGGGCRLSKQNLIMSKERSGKYAKPTSSSNCPSAIFAHELKSYSDSEDPVVVEYNRPLMEKKCMQSSAEYDPNLDLDIMVRELFRPNEWWKTRDLLFDSLAHFGTIHGFMPTKKEDIITCNRAGEKNYAREYNGGSLKAGCTFLFNLKAMHNPKVYPQNYNPDDPGKSKPRKRPDYTKETKIVREAPGKKSKPTCYNHGGGCRPSKQNLIMSKKRSGKHVKATSTSKILAGVIKAENDSIQENESRIVKLQSRITDGDAGDDGSAAGCDTEGHTYHANCPSAIFAHELKSYGDSEDPVVVGYNRPLMEKKCMQSSAEYDPTLDLDIIVRELFQPDEWWKTRDLLFDSLAHFGTIHGFMPTKREDIITCNRAGEKNYAREYKGGSLKAGCTFLFNLKAMHNPKVYPQNYNPDNPGKSTPRKRPDYTKETKIVREAPGKKSKPTCYNHGGGCRPSKQNLIMSKERSGKHAFIQGGKYVKATGSSKILARIIDAENNSIQENESRIVKLQSQITSLQAELSHLESQVVASKERKTAAEQELKTEEEGPSSKKQKTDT